MTAVTITPAQHAKMMQEAVLDARRRGLRFSERNVLVVLSEAVLSGAPITPEFQSVANAIVAKALIKGGKLPSKQGGRPKGGALSYDAEAVAGEYLALVDGGHKSEAAFEELARKHNKDSRTIQRIVSEGRMWHGDTKAARDQKRKSDAFMAGYGQEPSVEPIDHPDQGDRVELACLDEADALAKLKTFITPTEG